MAKKELFRIIIDGKDNGFNNMAKDEALLRSYQDFRIPTLRLYFWEKPCITLGVKQRSLDVINVNECKKEKISFVKRVTGGAALFHDNELTYSLVTSLDNLHLCGSVKESYAKLNQFILKFYSSFGLNAYFAKDASKYVYKPYGNYCFSSKEEYDIMIKGKKIGGNAQRRAKDVIFQHGVIPVSLNYELIKKLIKGVDDDIEEKTTCLQVLLGKKLDINDIVNNFIDSFTESFDVRIYFSKFNLHEKRIFEDLKEKYISKSWSHKYSNGKGIVA